MRQRRRRSLGAADRNQLARCVGDGLALRIEQPAHDDVRGIERKWRSRSPAVEGVTSICAAISVGRQRSDVDLDGVGLVAALRRHQRRPEQTRPGRRSHRIDRTQPRSRCRASGAGDDGEAAVSVAADRELPAGIAEPDRDTEVGHRAVEAACRVIRVMHGRPEPVGVIFTVQNAGFALVIVSQRNVPIERSSPSKPCRS